MEELFKSLSESVSEECYNDILNIVEEIISERDAFTRPRAAKNSIPGRQKVLQDASNKYSAILQKDIKDKGVKHYDVETENDKPVYIHRDFEDDKVNVWKKEPSPEVQSAYNNLRKAEGRLHHAEYAASGTVGKALDHEDEHQKKVAAAKEANKK